MKKYIYMIMTVLLILGNTMTAAAAGPSNVVYEGEASGILFPQGKNLFLDFAGAMPGDTLRQTVVVSNTSGKKIELRMRAETEEAYRDFVQKLNIRLDYTDADGKKSVLYEGSAAGWTKDGEDNPNLSLGKYENEEKGSIEVSLSIPASLGNEYEEAVGKIKWIFQAEEVSGESGHHHSSSGASLTSPKTGDETKIFLPLFGMAGALAMAAGLHARKRIQRQR